jgi:hypothetical protein
MNAGTCWGKNTIGPRGRSVEKAPGSDFNFNFKTVEKIPSQFQEHIRQKSKNIVGRPWDQILARRPDILSHSFPQSVPANSIKYLKLPWIDSFDILPNSSFMNHAIITYHGV